MNNPNQPMPPSSQREEALFAAAIARPEAERAAFLDGACLGNSALRQRLDALIAAHEQPEKSLTADTARAKATIKLDFADDPADAGAGHDGPSEHREGARCRGDGEWPAILRNGIGSRHSHYRILRPEQSFHVR